MSIFNAGNLDFSPIALTDLGTALSQGRMSGYQAGAGMALQGYNAQTQRLLDASRAYFYQQMPGVRLQVGQDLSLARLWAGTLSQQARGQYQQAIANGRNAVDALKALPGVGDWLSQQDPSTQSYYAGMIDAAIRNPGAMQPGSGMAPGGYGQWGGGIDPMDPSASMDLNVGGWGGYPQTGGGMPMSPGMPQTGGSLPNAPGQPTGSMLSSSPGPSGGSYPAGPMSTSAPGGFGNGFSLGSFRPNQFGVTPPGVPPPQPSAMAKVLANPPMTGSGAPNVSLNSTLGSLPAGAMDSPIAFTQNGAPYSPSPSTMGTTRGVVRGTGPGGEVTLADMRAAYGDALAAPGPSPMSTMLAGGPNPSTQFSSTGGSAMFTPGGYGSGDYGGGMPLFRPGPKYAAMNANNAWRAIDQIYKSLANGVTPGQAQSMADAIQQQFGVQVSLPMRPRDYGRPVGSPEFNQLVALLNDPSQTGPYKDKYGTLDLDQTRQLPVTVVDTTPSAMTQARQQTAQALSRLSGIRGDYLAGPGTDLAESRADLNDTNAEFIAGPKTDLARSQANYDTMRANTTATGNPAVDKILAQRARVLGQLRPYITGRTVVDAFGTEHQIAPPLSIDANGNLVGNPNDPQAQSALAVAGPLWQQQKTLNDQAAKLMQSGGGGVGTPGYLPPLGVNPPAGVNVPSAPPLPKGYQQTPGGNRYRVVGQ